MINSNISSMNKVKAKVELFNGSTLVTTCTCSDVLQSFKVDRIGESNKFFGFGICQKLSTVLIDLFRGLDIEASNSIEIGYIADDAEAHPYPTFFISEINRDEDNNSISITAYDALYKAEAHTVSELPLSNSYTVRDVADACIELLGLHGLDIIGSGDIEDCFDLYYPEGANFGGEESIRRVLNAIAEVTQTIYYIDNDDWLIFKRLPEEEAVTITRDDYWIAHTKTNRRLATIAHVTELGDNVEASLEVSGSTQYIRDNPFWNMRDDIYILVENALQAVGGLTINQFDCTWAGNILLEIGDKIEIITEDGFSVYSYVLNDTVTFDGSIEEFTEWVYENEEAIESNPTSLGDVINQTKARVDKANQRIDLEITNNNAQFTAINQTINSIQLSARAISEIIDAHEEYTDSRINQLSEQVTAKVDKDSFDVSVKEVLSDGVNEIAVSGKDYSFDKTGLHISSTDTEITNLIDETGMKVSYQGEEKLSASDKGVKAVDLHASTYLWIGSNSRLEDWQSNRTACFWIGG